MAAVSAERGVLRDLLRKGLAAARLDALLFAAATLVLLPALFGLAALLVLFAMAFGTGAGDVVLGFLGVGGAFLSGINLFLATTWLHTALRHAARPQARRDLVGALAVLALLLLYTYTSPAHHRDSPLFYLGYAFLALCLLGLLADLHQPQEDDDRAFLSWVAQPAALGLSFRRGHAAVGLAAALPGLLLGSFGEVLRSAWLLGRYDDETLDRAAAALAALADGARARAHGMLFVEERSARRARRLLYGLGYVRNQSRLPELTPAGDHLLLSARLSGRGAQDPIDASPSSRETRPT